MIKKYISKIQKNYQDYSVILFVDQEKLNITLNWTNNYSNNSYQYSNYYSHKQLIIINNYFKKFDNLEQIAIKLNQELKKTDNVSIEYNYDNILLTVQIEDEKNSTSVFFKLLQNKATNNSRNTFRSFDRKHNTMDRLRNNYNGSNDIKPILDDLTERISCLEDNMTQYHDYGFRKNNSRIGNHSVDNNNNNNLLLTTINNMLTRIIELDQSNQKKERRINELEGYINKNETFRNYNNYSMVVKPRGLIDEISKKSTKIEKRSTKTKHKLKNKKARSVVKKEKKFKNSDTSSKMEKNSKNNRNKSNDVSSHRGIEKIKKEIKKKKKIEEEKNNKSENSSELKVDTINIEIKGKEVTKEPSDLNSMDFNDNKTQINLPMVGREDLRHYVNSRIFFTKKELRMVRDKLLKGEKGKVVLLDVIYRATLDGDYENIVKNNTEGIYPQLILFYTIQGARFGIYVEKVLQKNLLGYEVYKEVPGTSFLISLNCLKTYDISQGKKATADREELLCFGRSFLFNKNGSNWLIFTPRNEFLGVQIMIGDQDSDFGKINIEEIVGTKITYQLKEVEIFKVSIEPIEDFGSDEGKTKNVKKVNNKNINNKNENEDETDN